MADPATSLALKSSALTPAPSPRLVPVVVAWGKVRGYARRLFGPAGAGDGPVSAARPVIGLHEPIPIHPIRNETMNASVVDPATPAPPAMSELRRALERHAGHLKPGAAEELTSLWAAEAGEILARFVVEKLATSEAAKHLVKPVPLPGEARIVEVLRRTMGHFIGREPIERFARQRAGDLGQAEVENIVAHAGSTFDRYHDQRALARGKW